MQVQKGAEEFWLTGGNGKAVLLLHGYTGSTGEMRPLGEYLQQRGYSVLGVRLPGHGTCAEDLENTTAGDWYAEAERGCKLLLKDYQEVYVAGLSMGGLLTIKLAAKLPIQKAAILAAPIYLRDKRKPLFPILKYFIRFLPKRKRDYRDAEKYNHCYTKMPTKPLGSLFTLLDECKHKLLPQIKIPCIVLQSTIEHTVNPKSARYIYDNLGSEEKQLVWFQHSGHILTLDGEREAVYEAVWNFFEK